MRDGPDPDKEVSPEAAKASQAAQIGARVFSGDKLIFLLLFTQMIPAIAIMIPLYLVSSRLNMLDRRITLVVIYCSFSLPFVIWMMRHS